MIFLSVVIPTCNKKETLKMALEALSRQSCSSDQFEVIIVDDGSTDGTVKEIEKIIPNLKFKTTLLFQKNRGPAAARNQGIKIAKGKIVLIINDDTIAEKDLLERHINFHKKYPQDNIGLLGSFTWHPNLLFTPFMYWLEHGGPYFSFNNIKKNQDIGWERFWTCNISAKRKFLNRYGLFDEKFPFPSWEDVEFGYRLGKGGFKLFYDRNALAYHYHPTTISSIKNKMRNNGYSVLILKNKIPKEFLPPLGRNPNFFIAIDRIFFNKPTAFLLEKACLFFEDKINLNIFYDLLLLHYRIEGVKKFLKK